MASRAIEWFFELKGNAAAEAKKLAEAVDRVNDSTERARKGALFGLGDQLESLGGMIGDVPVPGFNALGGAAQAAGASLQATTTPLGLAIVGIGGLGAAAVAGSAAMVGLVASADEWLAQLEEAGIAPDFISPEQVAAITSANAAMDDLGLQAKAAGVVLAGQFAENVETATLALSGLLSRLTDVGDALEASGIQERVQSWTRPLIAGLSFGASEGVRALWGSLVAEGERVSSELRDMSGDDMAAMLGFDAGPGSFTDGGAGGQVDAFNRRQQDAKKAAEDQTQAFARLGDAVENALAVDPWDAFILKIDRAKEQLRDLAVKAGNTPDAINLVATGTAALDAQIATKFREGLDAWLPSEKLLAQMQAIDAPTAEEIDAAMARVEGVLRTEAEAQRQAQQQAALFGIADQIGGLESALSGGLAGVVGMLGPHGAIASAVITLLPQLSGLLDGLMTEAMSFVDDLPGMLEELLGEGIPTFLANVPELVEGLILSYDDIIVAVVGSLDELIASVWLLPFRIIEAQIRAVGELAKAIGEGFVHAFGEVWGEIKEFFASLFHGDKTKTTGTNLADGRFFGVDLSPGDNGLFGALKSFDVGGAISRSGLAMVHEGELVGRPNQLRKVLSQGSGSPVNITIPVGTLIGSDNEAVRQLTEAIRAGLGEYGLGRSIDAYGGG